MGEYFVRPSRIFEDKKMRVLYETDLLILEHDYEETRLRKKIAGTILLKDNFYGDPYCGLIDVNNKWAIVAGEHLTIWTPEKSKINVHDSLKWVNGLREKNSDTVEILIDPWSVDSSVWEINIHTFEIKRIRDFLDYRDKEYTGTVIW